MSIASLMHLTDDPADQCPTLGVEHEVGTQSQRTRQRRWARRPLPIALLVLALLSSAGCGGGAGTSGDTAQANGGTSPTTETFSDPQPEPTDPDPTPTPRTREPSPAISIARLPVGGNHDVDETDAALQCAHVNWIASEDGTIPQGFAVKVTGFVFEPDVFEVLADGCGTPLPNCWHYVFTADQQRCDLAVRSVAATDQTPEVGLSGDVFCPVRDNRACARFVAALGRQQQLSIELDPPPVAETPPTEPTHTGTAPPKTPTESPGTATDSPEGPTESSTTGN